jgi:hypothetical protein
MSSKTSQDQDEDAVKLLADSDVVDVVDVVDDPFNANEEDEDDKEEEEDTKMPPPAAAHASDEKKEDVTEVNVGKKHEIVDLCGSSDSDVDDDYYDDGNHYDDAYYQQSVAMHASATSLASRTTRKRQRRQENRACQQAMPSNADVIELDLDPENDNDKTSTATLLATDVADGPAQLYLRVLGPLRFDFCHRMTQHTFLSVQPVARRNNLSRELLEYKLNLPIYISSSIFVRAMESRMDLLRALITGKKNVLTAKLCGKKTTKSKQPFERSSRLE